MRCTWPSCRGRCEPGRIVHPGMGPDTRSDVRGEHRRQRLGAQQRRVAVDARDGAGDVRQRRRARSGTACPVPCCSAWSTVSRPERSRRCAARPGRRRARHDERAGGSGAARRRPARAPSACGRAAGASSSASDERMRLPSPAARTMTVGASFIVDISRQRGRRSVPAHGSHARGAAPEAIHRRRIASEAAALVRPGVPVWALLTWPPIVWPMVSRRTVLVGALGVVGVAAAGSGAVALAANGVIPGKGVVDQQLGFCDVPVAAVARHRRPDRVRELRVDLSTGDGQVTRSLIRRGTGRGASCRSRSCCTATPPTRPGALYGRQLSGESRRRRRSRHATVRARLGGGRQRLLASASVRRSARHDLPRVPAAARHAGSRGRRGRPCSDISMGGYGALMCGLTQPDRFAAVVANAPAFWHSFDDSTSTRARSRRRRSGRPTATCWPGPTDVGALPAHIYVGQSDSFEPIVAALRDRMPDRSRRAHLEGLPRRHVLAGTRAGAAARHRHRAGGVARRSRGEFPRNTNGFSPRSLAAGDDRRRVDDIT